MIAISVKNLSKCYRMYATPAERMKELLHPFGKKYHKNFWALKDISFELKKGDSIGIIGRNGSGKSTLLQLLCGILQPTDGEVKVNGRISALLELGAGFSPEFTGRENVYLNGALMGYTREDMDEKYDDIISFADIGDFIDQPVKTYSSGMQVRLGFACAVNVDPDILIVDEALAVGDFKFQQKCFEKINDLRKNATVIFVSHSMRDIQMTCSKAVVLDRGRAVYQGMAEEAVEKYLELIETENEKIDSKDGIGETVNRSTIYGEIFHNKEKITDLRHSWVDSRGKFIETIKHGETLILDFSFRLLKPARNLIVGVPIWDGMGNMVTAIGTDMKKLTINVGEDGIIEGNLKIDNMVFNPGKYISYIAVVDGKESLYRNSISAFRVKDLPAYFGKVTPVHSWHFEKGTCIEIGQGGLKRDDVNNKKNRNVR